EHLDLPFGYLLAQFRYLNARFRHLNALFGSYFVLNRHSFQSFLEYLISIKYMCYLKINLWDEGRGTRDGKHCSSPVSRPPSQSPQEYVYPTIYMCFLVLCLTL